MKRSQSFSVTCLVTEHSVILENIAFFDYFPAAGVRVFMKQLLHTVTFNYFRMIKSFVEFALYFLHSITYWFFCYGNRIFLFWMCLYMCRCLLHSLLWAREILLGSYVCEGLIIISNYNFYCYTLLYAQYIIVSAWTWIEII